MKTKLFSALAILSALLFASCDNKDNDNGGIPEISDGRVQFTSDIALSRVSGAGGDIWDLGDQVGIYMLNKKDFTVLENNVNYMVSSVDKENEANTASFGPIPGGKVIYYPVDYYTRVSFLAYYPYQSGITELKYKLDVSDQSSQSKLDLIMGYANTEEGYNKAQKDPINILFTHKMAKVVINVKKGPGVAESLANLNVSVKNIKTTGTYTIDSWGLNVDSTPSDITPCKISGTANAYQCEMTLIPGDVAIETMIEFTLGGNVYKWQPWTSFENNNRKWSGGYKYTFNVMLTKHEVDVEGTIKKWNDISKGDVTGD